MDRINSADYVDIGGGKRGFRDENLSTGIAGTIVDAAWLNGLQEELLKLIEAAGLAPNAADWTQVRQAVGKLVGDAIDTYHATELPPYLSNRFWEYDNTTMRPWVASHVAAAQNDYHANVMTPYVADRISEYDLGVMRPWVTGHVNNYHANGMQPWVIDYVGARLYDFNVNLMQPHIVWVMNLWHSALWVDVKTQRAVNTGYHNNGTGMRQVSVSIAGTGTGAAEHTAYLDVSDSPDFGSPTNVAKSLKANRADETSQMFALIPKGKYYRVQASGTTTPTIAAWAEAT